MRTLLAIAATLLVAAPAGAATGCAPGTSNADYCEVAAPVAKPAAKKQQRQAARPKHRRQP